MRSPKFLWRTLDMRQNLCLLKKKLYFQYTFSIQQSESKEVGMPLLPEEIIPGAVAYMDQRAVFLNKDIEQVPEECDSKTRPYVCISASEGESTWLALTREYSHHRLEIVKKWRERGSKKWKTGKMYLNDARNTFKGPHDAFISLTLEEDTFDTIKRPRIAPVGMRAIERKIAEYAA